MYDFDRAVQALSAGEYTCVLCKGEEIITSQARGVKPLVRWYVSGRDFSGFSAADKVVGKATAFLYALLKVKAVYAAVISQGALEVLAGAGIEARYGQAVPNIINRKGDGICPFEEAVLDIQDAPCAYLAIRSKMEEMNIAL